MRHRHTCSLLTAGACFARLSSTALATGVSAGDITTLQSNIDAVQDNVEALGGQLVIGAGVPLTLAPYDSGAGSGSAVETPLTISPMLTLVNTHKYRINGSMIVHNAAGDTVLGVREIHDVVVRYVGGAGFPSATEGTGTFVVSNKHASFSSYFQDEADFPDLSDNAGALSVLYTLKAGQQCTIEFDGTIADLGTNA